MSQLYRIYDNTGSLVYVGIADNWTKRFRQHAETKSWWPEVSSVTIEHFHDRDEARLAERRAIENEAPSRNLQHNALVRDAEQPSDEQTASLFDGSEYSPPRCLTLRDPAGVMRHKGIEHATPRDGENYTRVLHDNITAAQVRYQDWQSFTRTIAVEWERHGTIGAALRARQSEQAAA